MVFDFEMKDNVIFSEMPGSSCMDLSIVGAGLVWYLTDFRVEQVSLVACQLLQAESRDQF